jgi:hypothetical protein
LVATGKVLYLYFILYQNKKSPELQAGGFLLYYSMRIYVIKSGKEYEASIPAPDPDTDQVMYLVEKIVTMMDLPKEEVDNYIIAWAEEIKQVLK